MLQVKAAKRSYERPEYDLFGKLRSRKFCPILPVVNRTAYTYRKVMYKKVHSNAVAKIPKLKKEAQALIVSADSI